MSRDTRSRRPSAGFVLSAHPGESQGPARKSTVRGPSRERPAQPAFSQRTPRPGAPDATAGSGRSGQWPSGRVSWGTSGRARRVSGPPSATRLSRKSPRARHARLARLRRRGTWPNAGPTRTCRISGLPRLESFGGEVLVSRGVALVRTNSRRTRTPSHTYGSWMIEPIGGYGLRPRSARRSSIVSATAALLSGR